MPLLAPYPADMTEAFIVLQALNNPAHEGQI